MSKKKVLVRMNWEELSQSISDTVVKRSPTHPSIGASSSALPKDSRRASNNVASQSPHLTEKSPRISYKSSANDKSTKNNGSAEGVQEVRAPNEGVKAGGERRRAGKICLSAREYLKSGDSCGIKDDENKISMLGEVPEPKTRALEKVSVPQPELGSSSVVSSPGPSDEQSLSSSGSQNMIDDRPGVNSGSIGRFCSTNKPLQEINSPENLGLWPEEKSKNKKVEIASNAKIVDSPCREKTKEKSIPSSIHPPSNEKLTIVVKDCNLRFRIGRKRDSSIAGKHVMLAEEALAAPPGYASMEEGLGREEEVTLRVEEADEGAILPCIGKVTKKSTNKKLQEQGILLPVESKKNGPDEREEGSDVSSLLPSLEEVRAERSNVCTPPRLRKSLIPKMESSKKTTERGAKGTHAIATLSSTGSLSRIGNKEKTDESWISTSRPVALNNKTACCPKEKGTRLSWSSKNPVSSFPSPRSRSMPQRSLTSKNRRETWAGGAKKLPLSVQREKSRRLSESMRPSMDADETRRNLDKRSARLKYSEFFKADIAAHRIGDSSEPVENRGSSREISSDVYRCAKNGVAVFVRKRPIFDYEVDRRDYDVVSIDTQSTPPFQKVVVHHCGMHSDMRRMHVKDISFPCTAAYDEHCCNSTLYNKVAEPLVRAAAAGGVSTILMYGQTGSGKTYTMTGIEERLTTSLFKAEAEWSRELAQLNKNQDPSLFMPTTSVRFIELAGKACRDLLAPKGGECNLRIMDDDDGSVCVVDASNFVVDGPEDLAKIIVRGKKRRATEATDANGVSSRSHAVLQIEITMSDAGGGDRGVLTLIDCAGSERRNDSLYHSSERQKESAEINSSLWSLKECVRARTQISDALLSPDRTGGNKPPTVHVPYRASNLTRILRESFERDGAKLCVIATVAPNATDTEHTLETLKTVANIAAMENSIKEGRPRFVVNNRVKDNVIAPKNWDNKRLTVWLKKKGVSPSKVPSEIDGKAIMRMTKRQLSSKLCDGQVNKGESLFHALRVESDRVAKHQLKKRNELRAMSKGFN